MKKQPKSHQGPRFPTGNERGISDALFLAMLPLLLAVLLALSGCGGSSNSAPAHDTLAPGPCASSPALGAWFSASATDLLELRDTCDGTRTRCHQTFLWQTFPDGVTAHVLVRYSDLSDPACLPLGSHECHYSIDSASLPWRMALDCGAGPYLYTKLR